MNYQKMYLILFNTITDALNEMTHLNYGNAAETLQQAQIKAEAVFIDGDERIRGGETPSPYGNLLTVPSTGRSPR